MGDNDISNSIGRHSDRKSKCTPKDILHIVETLRARTVDPPENSILHTLKNNYVGNMNGNDDDMSTNDDVQEEDYEDDYESGTKRIPDIVPSTQNPDRINSQSLQPQHEIKISIHNTNAAIKGEQIENPSNQSGSGKQHPQVPWQSLIRTYDLMYNQDSLQYCASPLKRRKMHYLEYPYVMEKLKSFENKAFKLNLKEEEMLRKQKDLGLIKCNKKV